jgi:hypothetical protein
VLFPTGGVERYSEEFLFKSGFSLLVRDVLRPTDMVYACYVNEADAKTLKKQTSARLLSAVAGFKRHLQDMWIMELVRKIRRTT